MSIFPIPDPVTPAWLTLVLTESGRLPRGSVAAVESNETGAFNSRTQHLTLHYSDGAQTQAADKLVLKRNIPEPWGVEAGAEEVQFYDLVAALDPPPPALVECYAAKVDSASGDSFLLLRDLSDTHVAPVTREQQIGIVDGVPSAEHIAQVVDALAWHHAYWWDHPLLRQDLFHVGYWSRNADRFEQYFERRQRGWQDLKKKEATWFPRDLIELYDDLFAHLHQHWERYLEPRFRTSTHLTLVHGDAYFANFLCPLDADAGAAYLLDWQSPCVDIGGYDLANLIAPFWTSDQRHEDQREQRMLERYYTVLTASGVTDYAWDDLIVDYKSGLIFWVLMPVQDRFGGSSRDYWWPKMQCLVAAFRDWQCAELLGMAT